MLWNSFSIAGTVYSLEHLHPFSYDLVIAEKQGKPAQSYRLNVIFGLHCFTRGPKKGEMIPTDLAYSDNRETRIFDLARYEQSKLLPDIIRRLPDLKCFHDTHGNFYVFEVIDASGVVSYYSVFFTLSKAGKKAGLNLYISSAHMREERPYAHRVKPIGFRVLVHNVHAGRPVRPAPGH